jgi:cytochrome c-type biogenesis protein CcmH
MILWLVFAILIAGTLALLLAPLLRRSRPLAARFDHDIQIWRDQLAEIERELAGGLLAQPQADQAKLEIERRILAAAEREKSADTGPSVRVIRRRRLIAAALVILVAPTGTLLVYGVLGRPDLPDRPFAERSKDPDYKTERLADSLGLYLSGHPSAAGYGLLGRMLSTLGRYDESAESWRQAILAGDTSAEAYASLGEVITDANRNQVVPDARAAFHEALKLTPGDAKSRFYLGLAAAQDGAPADAVAIWRDLEADTPANAPWRSMLDHQIMMVAAAAGLDPAKITPKKP